MMAVIYNDNDAVYDAVEMALHIYLSQVEAVQQEITSLVAAYGALQKCWNCKTANVFYKRFADEYKPALDKASEALESSATFFDGLLPIIKGAAASCGSFREEFFMAGKP